MALYPLFFAEPKEPVFEGKTLTEWLSSDEFESARYRVDFAVLCMGDDAVPALKRLLRGGTKLERLSFRKSPLWMRAKWPSTFDFYQLKWQALEAVEVLGITARATTPELIDMISDISEFPELRVKAMNVLRVVYPEDESVVLNALKGAMQDANSKVRRSAAAHVRTIGELLKARANQDFWRRLTNSQSGVATNITDTFPVFQLGEWEVTLEPGKKSGN